MQPCCPVLWPPQVVHARSWCALIPTRAEVVEWLSGSMGTTESPVCGTGEPSVWYRCRSSPGIADCRKRGSSLLSTGLIWFGPGVAVEPHTGHFCSQPMHVGNGGALVKHFELHLLALCSLAFDIVLTCFLGRNIVCL